ncbi:aminopeptidase [Halosimplex litoreum]|uniref:Aminopeptidase n=1 Tax=Halosimplex litoreum TaxID=1198301 RepID=A0A7T3FXY9_9EURY|nr:aminopeptidase [Halosimplex litoreum]QPV62740.1 aminopeptidase [Halosimplex litoreum]
MVDSDEGASGDDGERPGDDGERAGDDGERAGDNRAAETGGGPDYVDGVEGAELVDASPDSLTLTPEQHERLKTHVHGDRLSDIQYSDRRYLVVGRGGDDGPGRRRRRVRDQLDDRREATAFMLEDFGLSGEEIDLWAPGFEILCEQASHVVGVLEDYDGGHVWELGYLYHEQSRVRDALWLLKRTYESDERRRERYDNGMAASHLAALERVADDRVVRWDGEGDLRRAVEEIP